MALRERTGILVVRAWTEGNQGELRARLIWSPDISTRPEVVTTTTSAEELHATIQAWLDMLLAGSERDSAAGPSSSGDLPVMEE